MEEQQEAISDYTRAISLKPDYSEAFVNRGLVLQAMGRSIRLSRI